jgi:hypothetical protein
LTKLQYESYRGWTFRYEGNRKPYRQNFGAYLGETLLPNYTLILIVVNAATVSNC